jgi:hypothetical protein
LNFIVFAEPSFCPTATGTHAPLPNRDFVCKLMR